MPLSLFHYFTMRFGVDIDGTPMVDKRFTKLMDGAIATANSYLMKYHCIIRQENSHAKVLKMNNFMKTTNASK